MTRLEEIAEARVAAAVSLIRLMVGAVFLSEGIQKFLFPAAHEARTDYCMLLGLVFLLVVGGGPWSLDARRVASGTLH